MKRSSSKLPLGGVCTNLLLLLVATLCLAFSSVSHAEIHFVYRFDLRPPVEIFQNGFQPRGQDMNLLHHVLLDSQGNGSGFIATTSDYGSALGFAERFLNSEQDSAGYIYRVAVDDSFYDVHHSLRTFLEQGVATGAADRHINLVDRVELAMDEFEDEEEFVAAGGGIAPSRISGAIPVRLELQGDGIFRLIQGDFQENQNAPDIPVGSASTEPYPMSWPSDGESSSSSCVDTDSDSGSGSDGAVGANCTGDVYAVAGPGGYIHPLQFPDCHSPQRKKRIEASCRSPTLINVSRRMRILKLMSSDL